MNGNHSAQDKDCIVGDLKLPSQNCPTKYGSDLQCELVHFHEDGQLSLSTCHFLLFFFF